MAGSGSGGRRGRKLAAFAGASALMLATGAGAAPAWAGSIHSQNSSDPGHISTTTPIKHLVVLFDENVSFDHYFGTYPKAANTDGTTFTAAKGTPTKITNLTTSGLLESNPNLYAPKRLSSSELVTCDQNHNYAPEQKAYDGGKADLFVQNTDADTCSGGLYGAPGLGMDYYDGNTVTAMWNLAQNYSLGDNFFGDVYGPSTPGALSLVSGQTHGVESMTGTGSTTDPTQTTTPDSYTVQSPNAQGVGTDINDPDPAYDDCSNTNRTTTYATAAMTGTNIGDLLDKKKVTWGWFQGGFTPTKAYAGSGTYAVCGATHTNAGGTAVADYWPHHDPFQYYKSTANPHHLAPASLSEVGNNGQANHQYDLSYFDKVVAADDLPAVSFLKAAGYEDGHAGYSDPKDEQNFIVKEINQLEKSPEWSSTAVVIAYDDSDGWYDQVYHSPTNGSKDTSVDSAACQAAGTVLGGYADRCGVGPRLPLLVISQYAKTNKVNDTFTQQSSILQFIEDNWRTGSIGDSSFDAKAGSLDSFFDFKHPTGKRLQLNADGTVASVSRIHHGDNGDTRASITVEPVAASAPSSPLAPAGIGLAALAAVGTGYAMARRNRRSNNS